MKMNLLSRFEFPYEGSANDVSKSDSEGLNGWNDENITDLKRRFIKSEIGADIHLDITPNVASTKNLKPFSL